MRSQARTLSLSLALGLITAATAHAACPTAPVYVDLKTGTAVAIGSANPQVTFLSPFTNSQAAGCSGWKEAVLKIDLTGCTKASLVAEWEGVPKDWTLNIGDSPTDDGFAGDAGTTVNDAEMWILGEQMSIANNGASPDNPIYAQHLSLTDSSLKFVVKNQFISWGQPYGFLQTPASKVLFALPDNDPATSAAEKGSKIYAGLNRVIGSNNRRGCGLRRVVVALQ